MVHLVPDPIDHFVLTEAVRRADCGAIVTFLGTVRDLTDGLYDPRKPPHVSHDAGVALLVGHVEKYWCPSIPSSDVLN